MKRRITTFLTILWMAVIFLLSSEPADESSSRSDVFTSIATDYLHVSLTDDILTFLTRKAAHIFIYFVLGILVYNVVRLYSLSAKQAILLSIGIVMTYAGLDEVHQLFVSGRSGEVRDVLIDTTAGAVGVGVTYAVLQMKQRLQRPKL